MSDIDKEILEFAKNNPVPQPCPRCGGITFITFDRSFNREIFVSNRLPPSEPCPECGDKPIQTFPRTPQIVELERKIGMLWSA